MKDHINYIIGEIAALKKHIKKNKDDTYSIAKKVGLEDELKRLNKNEKRH